METFYLEPLFVRDFNINFRPEKHFLQKKHLNISSLNIPPETPDEPLTQFLLEYPDIVGSPIHSKKIHNGILYCTGTRVDQVDKLHQNIPQIIHNMFGRTTMCIYNDHPINKHRTERNNYGNYDKDTGTKNINSYSDNNQNPQPHHKNQATATGKNQQKKNDDNQKRGNQKLTTKQHRPRTKKQ